jgi:hypothetical protein
MDCQTELASMHVGPTRVRAWPGLPPPRLLRLFSLLVILVPNPIQPSSREIPKHLRCDHRSRHQAGRFPGYGAGRLNRTFSFFRPCYRLSSDQPNIKPKGKSGTVGRMLGIGPLTRPPIEDFTSFRSSLEGAGLRKQDRPFLSNETRLTGVSRGR